MLVKVIAAGVDRGDGEAMLKTGVFTSSSFGDGVEVMYGVAG